MYKIRTYKSEWENIKTARLDISIGQEYHEGDKMIAAAEWASRHFDRVVVNICDTLQRHNFQFSNIPADKAYNMSLAAGDAWIERNRVALNMLPNLEIVRWDEWLSNPEFGSAKKRVLELYKTDNDFRSYFDTFCEEVWNRKKTKDEQLKEKFIFYSKRYFLEEVAVIFISSFDNIADIYPGSFPKLFDYLRDNDMPAPKSMTTIGFRKQKTSKSKAA